jgi:hypothetical protein
MVDKSENADDGHAKHRNRKKGRPYGSTKQIKFLGEQLLDEFVDRKGGLHVPSLFDDAFDGITNPRQRASLTAVSISGVITYAATAAGVSPSMHSYWWNRDTGPQYNYRSAYNLAVSIAGAVLEMEARRRALIGVVRHKFKPDGKPILHPSTGKPYTERDYSDKLLILLLKGAMPENYR